MRSPRLARSKCRRRLHPTTAQALNVHRSGCAASGRHPARDHPGALTLTAPSTPHAATAHARLGRRDHPERGTLNGRPADRIVDRLERTVHAQGSLVANRESCNLVRVPSTRIGGLQPDRRHALIGTVPLTTTSQATTSFFLTSPPRLDVERPGSIAANATLTRPVAPSADRRGTTTLRVDN